MYDLEDLAEIYGNVWGTVDDVKDPIGLVPYELDYSLLWEIQLKYVAIASIFYPITFTIIYTPIALLLAIPVVLYKHVFKLG